MVLDQRARGLTGLRLAEEVSDLKEAALTRVTVSLDALDSD